MAVAVRTTMRADARSAAAARRFVADVLLQRGFPDGCIADAILLTSEAVTYAIDLGGSAIGVQVAAEPCMSRVEVHLLDRANAAGISSIPEPPSGTRLQVIQALAEAWGVEPEGPRARFIWFELRG